MGKTPERISNLAALCAKCGLEDLKTALPILKGLANVLQCYNHAILKELRLQLPAKVVTCLEHIEAYMDQVATSRNQLGDVFKPFCELMGHMCVSELQELQATLVYSITKTGNESGGLAKTQGIIEERIMLELGIAKGAQDRNH